MSGKRARQVRKEFNKLEYRKREVANQIALELLNAPFKYRFGFAMKVIFHRRKKG